MPSYDRPGVYVEESLSASSAVTQPTSGVAAFVQAFARGPVVPTRISSWFEFLQRFGGFSSAGASDYLPFAVHQYFANGGRQAWVHRYAHSDAVTATRTLNDRAGTPAATLIVKAANPGAWGNSIYIDITDQGSDRFNLIVRFGGTTDGYIVERWTDLSMVDSDSRYVEAIINSPTLGSKYIVVTDQDSVTAAPGDRPAVTAASVLATGANGGAPSTSEIEASISLLDQVPGLLTVNMPGVTDATVLAYLLGYVDGRGNAFAVVDPAPGSDAATVISFAASLASPNAAVYYPWLYATDPSSSVAGSTKLVPPGGAVAGIFARIDTLRGVHKAPAGLEARISGAVAVERRLTSTDLGSLNVAQVNAIRQIPGAGIVVMGARTLKNTTADRYVPVRRTLNFLKMALVDGTLWAAFEPNDTVLWSGLRQRIERFLLQQWQAGALRGTSPAEAFYVKCDADNNDPTSGQVNIEVGVALQFPAEFIVIKIGQWQGGSTSTVAA